MSRNQRNDWWSGEIGTMILLIIPFGALLLTWVFTMWLLLRRPSPTVLKSSDKETELAVLTAEVERVQQQLNELQEPDNRAFDLVLATLGSLVAVAVIVPAAATLSQTLSNRNERNQIKKQIRAELEEWVNQEIGTIVDYLLLIDYRLSKFIVNEAHIEDVKRVLDIQENDELSTSEVQTKTIENLKTLQANHFMEWEIHNYPLVLQDISKTIQTHHYLNSLNYLRLDQFYPSLKKQLDDFLLLLMVMTYPVEKESDTDTNGDVGEKKIKYIFPRLTPRQRYQFRELFDTLKKQLESEKESNKSIKTEELRKSLETIKLICNILVSDTMSCDFNFTRVEN